MQAEEKAVMLSKGKKMELKNLDELYENWTDQAPPSELRDELKEEAIKLVKEVKRLIEEYEKDKPSLGNGSWWETEDGKQFKEVVEKKLIEFTEDGGPQLGSGIFFYFLNITEADLK